MVVCVVCKVDVGLLYDVDAEVAVVALVVYLQSHLYPSVSESQPFATSSRTHYITLTHTHTHNKVNTFISPIFSFVWFLVSVSQFVA